MASLSGGKRACMATVSNSMPRKVSVVAGPSVLCGASGIFSFAQSLVNEFKSRSVRSLVGCMNRKSSSTLTVEEMSSL